MDNGIVDTLRLINEVEAEIQKSETYQTILSLFEVVIRNPKIKSEDLRSEIESLLNQSGYTQKIQNLVYHYLVKNELLDQEVHGTAPQKEPILYIQKAQINWEHRILKSLNTMCNDLGISLSRKRPVSEQKELEAKWSALGSEEMDLSQFRPVYSSRDFLDVLSSIQNPNILNPNEMGPVSWGCIKVPFFVKDLKELTKEYVELSARVTHLGVDDCPPASKEEINKFVQERMSLGKKVIQDNSVFLAREYTKRGCPQSLRSEMWCIILGVDVGNPERLRFEHLKNSVFQHDLMIDKLFFKDVRLTAANDDQYFVFEDMLYQVLLCFSRDVSVLSHFDRSAANPPRGKLRNKQPQQDDSLLAYYPPNGVIPFHGFAMYVAPFCYMYDDPVALYFVFKEAYCRLFFRLHCVSSHPQGILCLCLTFEKLLQEQEPQLVQHFISKGIQPLKIVLRWLMRAFSGYLSAEQTLHLWDRILAYNSLQLLPLLSVAIFSFRSEVLMKADTQATAEAMLSDISCLKVIPLLQQILGAA